MANKKWTAEKERFLIENYSKMSVKKIAKELEVSPNTIWLKADILHLKRNGSYNRKKISGGTQCNTAPVTVLTKTLVCSASIRGEDAEIIAADTGRTVEQIRQVLNACKEDGTYEYIRQNINRRINPYSANNSCCRLCSGKAEV